MKRKVFISYDSVLGLAKSHSKHDNIGFHRFLNEIASDLSLSNRPSEAKILRESLASINGNGKLNSMEPHPNLAAIKSGEALIYFVESDIQPEDVVLSNPTKKAIDRIIEEHRLKSRLEEAGLKPQSKILFWGPPGCGKTISAYMLATQLGLPLGIVRLSAVITSYVGETSSNLQKVFRQANELPMVILLDEADAIAKNREDRNDVGELKRVVNSLLQAMDAMIPGRSILIFASNHQHLFDPAIWRRFDDVVEFPKPDHQSRFILLKRLTSGLKISGSLEAAARSMQSASYADITRVCLEVTKTAVLLNRKQLTTTALIESWKTWKKKKTIASIRQRTD